VSYASFFLVFRYLVWFSSDFRLLACLNLKGYIMCGGFNISNILFYRFANSTT